MEWHVVDGDPTDPSAARVAWEREDRFARVVVRRTATDAWAVTLDRLQQAPEGQAYRRETVADRETALDRAATWREEQAGDTDGTAPDGSPGPDGHPTDGTVGESAGGGPRDSGP
jgi:hypothetical protein